MCLQVGRMGPVSDDGPRQNNSVRSEGPWGRAALAARTAVLWRATFPGTVRGVQRWKRRVRRTEANRTPRRLAVDGKALSEMLALKPERGKPAFRNFREGDRNGGIIRSPLRAIALPDSREMAGNQDADLVYSWGRQHWWMRHREHPLDLRGLRPPICMEPPRARTGRPYRCPTRSCERAGRER